MRNADLAHFDLRTIPAVLRDQGASVGDDTWLMFGERHHTFAVVDELTDRYGVPPAPVLNLLAVARFRVAMRALGITEVSLQGRAIRISPVVLPESKQMRLARLAEGASYKAAVETISLKVPVGPDRRTPLRDVALLENLHATLKAVLEPPAIMAS